MFSLRSMFQSLRPAVFDAPIAPDRAFFAIGDIHGDYVGMERILNRIEEISDDPMVVCVGDYVDRGERSAEVLGWLHHVNTLYPQDFVCLAGNHEEMMTRFLQNPEGQGDRWLAFGGLQTLQSYSVRKQPETTMTDLRDQLAEAMGDDLIQWLGNLPASWQSGNVAVTHAGADPSLPVAGQPRRNLLWGHPDFQAKVRDDGVWVVHGHTIVERPEARDGRISIDTGAYVTGRLTAALIHEGNVEFISTRD
ncbi:metallophosphoesterase family protein [Citreimonas salinaria]|uniref:Serine/threonine protein phosphatase 1 n=1 Tax=Citreimonas salinaria TaxID=321339 RepID=A0A1H3F9B3_9RHOB|nr:metallophosphoesterase family protein [Citreimonas salinaria]SDX87562.1 serine/threonine protein phosphatase 1 [Citreimonas salinaria]